MFLSKKKHDEPLNLQSFSLNILHFYTIQISLLQQEYIVIIWLKVLSNTMTASFIMESNLILLNLNYFSLLITCLPCNFYYKHFSSDNSQASITSDNFVSKDRKINRVFLNSSNLTDLENAAIYYDDCSAAYKQKKYIISLIFL